MLVFNKFIFVMIHSLSNNLFIRLIYLYIRLWLLDAPKLTNFMFILSELLHLLTSIEYVGSSTHGPQRGFFSATTAKITHRMSIWVRNIQKRSDVLYSWFHANLRFRCACGTFRLRLVQRIVGPKIMKLVWLVVPGSQQFCFSIWTGKHWSSYISGRAKERIEVVWDMNFSLEG